MARIPEPAPGLVVRYDFLWSDDHAVGRDHGKDRPACLVAHSSDQSGNPFVVFLPITHSEPRDGTIGIEVPARVREHLGLDDQRSWIIVSEHNVDSWVSPGLSPARPDSFANGFIPPRLFAQVKEAFIAAIRAGESQQTRRDG